MVSDFKAGLIYCWFCFSLDVFAIFIYRASHYIVSTIASHLPPVSAPGASLDVQPSPAESFQPPRAQSLAVPRGGGDQPAVNGAASGTERSLLERLSLVFSKQESCGQLEGRGMEVQGGWEAGCLVCEEGTYVGKGGGLCCMCLRLCSLFAVTS